MSGATAITGVSGETGFSGFSGFSGETVFPLVIGVISAAFFSYLAIAWLLKYLQKNNTWVFIWYRLAFGILILLSSFVKFS
jgi:undecaprenyl-diphosphatase